MPKAGKKHLSTIILYLTTSKIFSQIEISNGESLSRAAVTSGVPQGTVLGPLLFLVYTNDLHSRVSSSVRLFADDCLLYRVIRDQQDAVSLQTDLNHLQEWEREWQMVFNPDKCEHIRITNKPQVIQHSQTDPIGTASANQNQASDICKA